MTVVLLRYYANITIFLRDYFVKRQKKYQEKQQKKQQRVKNTFVDAILYALLSGFLVAIIYYFYYFDPVTYTRLITEDQWGEYAAAICFVLAGLLMILLVPKGESLSQKVIWSLIGLAALFISGEDLSWGQRIFNIPTPDWLDRINEQHELTLHNIKGVNSGELSVIIAYLLIGWSVFSGLVTIFPPQLKDIINKIGLPIIPIRFMPIFLIQPYFQLFYPVAKADEIGELFLGFAAITWSFDLALQKQLIKLPTVIATISILSLVISMALLITSIFPGELRSRLNRMASRDYPSFEMYDQAIKLYDYIESHPQYLTPDTWINHCRLLIAMNKKQDAYRILDRVASDSDLRDLSEAERYELLRQKRIMEKLLADHS